MSVEPMYAVTEIATAWNVSKNSIYALINGGELEAVDIGHGRVKIRIPESALKAYIRSLPPAKRQTRTTSIRGHLKVVAA